jgi:hypothetical protein
MVYVKSKESEKTYKLIKDWINFIQ